LVGALEMIADHFNKNITIVDGYRCEDYIIKLGASAKSMHARGKAANIKVDEISPIEVYKFAATIPEIKGMGLYPDDGFIHIDIRREDEKKEWIREGGRVTPLSADKKTRYGLS
ncbi:MAG: D-Ala-D-Ala carboxypeptidase family metallohydrolase, partial [bacterium]